MLADNFVAFAEPYDDSTPQGILNHALRLKGLTFADVLTTATRGEFSIDAFLADYIGDEFNSLANKARKGGLGNLLEQYHFGYIPNNTSEADFPKAGVELKVSPYEINAKREIKAGERLVLSMISHNSPIENSLEESHLWKKCRLLLLIYYLRDKTLPCNLMYRMDYVDLFTPSRTDYAIIRNDYRTIAEKIRSGHAHELSEGDTIYLGACTKGADSESSLQSQYYNPDIPAKRRAWCYKQPYMTWILRGYLSKGVPACGQIFDERKTTWLDNHSFAEVLEYLVRDYIGMSVEEIRERLVVASTAKAKNFYSQIAMKMLGVDGETAEEFEKANIKIKTIRLEEDGSMREHFRLFDADFCEFDRATNFSETDLYKFVDKSLMFILVFKDDGFSYKFNGAFLWHMSYADISQLGKEADKARAVIRKGIRFTVKSNKVTNNLPKPSQDGIFHIRTHANRSYYMFDDERGTVGNGKLSDTVAVPHTNHRCTRHSYWLNKWYMISQIKRFLKI